MVSQAQLKHIKSLQQKKFRNLHQQFVVEGEKMVEELILSNFEVVDIFYTDEFSYPLSGKISSSLISFKDLKKVSTLKTPNKAIAIAKIPSAKPIDLASNNYSLVLDQIQDPGNLGTIIRTADWFGIPTIYCSSETVDCYNPKVIQSTMGSIFRVSIHYVELSELYAIARQSETPIIGTSLKGQNLYADSMPKHGLVVMGNESKGISDLTQTNLSYAVKIPSYPENSKVESLNVSIATALICGELRRP